MLKNIDCDVLVNFSYYEIIKVYIIYKIKKKEKKIKRIF